MRRCLRLAPAALLAAALVSLAASRGAQTVPLFAARTGLLCQNCHFDPNGGGPRNDFGFAYARNRHDVDVDPDSTSPWRDLELTNRIGHAMPVTIGVNQRFMLLGTDAGDPEGIDRLGFFNMENALHVAFQPHPQLTLVYTADAFPGTRDGSSNFRSKEAFGIVGGLPFEGYLRAGRFRVPFGLRMDDHTVATRNAFLDFTSRQSFLPYDPRHPDMGLEIGARAGMFAGRASFTNGEANALARHHAETKAIKLIVHHDRYEGGISLYDEYNRAPSGLFQRATRWGYYGMTRWGPVTALGEVAAGTDEEDPPLDSGLASGPQHNRLAWFAELDVTPVRWLNARLRYDHLVLERDDALREANTHRRWALEAEWLPVPFAEIRAVARRIDHELDTLEDETQGYLQFHFSY